MASINKNIITTAERINMEQRLTAYKNRTGMKQVKDDIEPSEINYSGGFDFKGPELLCIGFMVGLVAGLLVVVFILPLLSTC